MRQFTQNNESFQCINCGIIVPKHPSSSRDHCNNCLFSLHVDKNPGDRQNLCQGLMTPVGIEQFNGKMRINYKCLICGVKTVNVIAPDDNYEQVVIISSPL